MRYLNEIRTLFLCSALALTAGACEDLPMGPGGLDGITESGTAANGAGLSLRDLFAAAVFRVQRVEGADSAFAVLGRWRDAREGGADDREVREIEARTVIRAFGADVVDRAAAVVGGELGETTVAAERVGDPRLATRIRPSLDAAAEALASGRALAAHAPERALVALDDAAAHLGEARFVIVEAERLPSLDELYNRALERAGTAAPAARAEHARLSGLAEQARAESGTDARYRAAQALRQHETRFTVSVLGEAVCERVIADLDQRIEELRPRLDSLDRAGADVARDRRMLDAAEGIRERALAALAAGDPATALDLGLHGAGILDELRRRRAR